MKKAGYLCRDGHEVLDGEGVPREVVFLFIHGARLCIPVDELSDVIENGSICPVKRVKQNWMEYLGREAGTASLSRSGRALNISLVNGDRFTLPLESVRDVLSFRERFAPIMEVFPGTEKKYTHNHLLTDFVGPLSSCPA
jgi:hypothetical protein